MKIITLFKSFLAVGVAAVGITSAVVFSNVNNVPKAYTRVLTKNNYNAIKNAQGNSNVLNINYQSLPTSSKTVSDLLTTNYPTDQAFMFTVGSQAYATTNLLLNGIEKDWDKGANTDATSPTSSLMLELYDLFYSGKDSQLSSINMSFYNYLDIVATKEYMQAENTLTSRRTNMGDLPPDKINYDNSDSRQWNVLNENGRIEPTSPNLQPVVRDGAKFIYYPNPEAFYEFRKDNKHDTEYERIYYRNDTQTRAYIDTTAWITTYSNSYIKTTFSREGALICAKYDSTDNKWVFQSFAAPEDFKNTGKGTTKQSIISFYKD